MGTSADTSGGIVPKRKFPGGQFLRQAATACARAARKVWRPSIPARFDPSHNSRSVGLPPEFFQSAEVFARKWQHRLPVATPCVVIDEDGRVWVLENSPSDHRVRAEGEAGI